MSEVKRGIIETIPVEIDEIDGVCFDKFGHGYELGKEFTYCGRPIREFAGNRANDKRATLADIPTFCNKCAAGTEDNFRRRSQWQLNLGPIGQIFK